MKLKGKLILPDKLKTIGYNAFAECKGFSDRLIIPESVQSIGKNAFFNCRGIEDVVFENSSVEIGVFAFSNMHIKCFDNTPKVIKTNDPEIYSSDNFKGSMLSESFLNFHCAAFYAIDSILIVITSIASCGAVSTGIVFAYNWFIKRKTNVNKYKEVFTEIINKERSEKDLEDNAITLAIINKINERIATDSIEEEFTVTENQAMKALEDSFNETWPTILIKHRRDIIEKAFNDIEFREKCCKCKKCGRCKKSSDDDNKSPLELRII